jgi:glycerol-3-phosphate acyltransferase PlsY
MSLRVSEAVDMEVILKSVAVIIVAYLLGSISWAYIIGRFARGVDMMEVGDGRVGASFSIRRLGYGWGITVGVLDFLKGIVAVGTAVALELPVITIVLGGIAAVAGHNWSVFYGFRGGRGAASTFGILAVLALPALLLACFAVAVPFFATRGMKFFYGILRTTFLFAIAMLLTSLVVLVDTATGFLPDLPWIKQPSTLFAVLPPALLILNVIKKAPKPDTI